jgi:hypothetical protein
MSNQAPIHFQHGPYSATRPAALKALAALAISQSVPISMHHVISTAFFPFLPDLGAGKQLLLLSARNTKRGPRKSLSSSWHHSAKPAELEEAALKIAISQS